MDYRLCLRTLPRLALGLTLLVVSCSSDEDKKPADSDGPILDGGLDLTAADKGPRPDANPATKPVIKQILPPDGPADGGRNGTIRVNLVGENFAPNMTVYIDGGQDIISTISFTSTVSVAFNLPKNPYGPPYDKPAKVTVQVRVGDQSSNLVDFQYTVAKATDADNTGAVISTAPKSFRDYASEPIAVKVYVKGVTDVGSAAPAKLRVELGMGKPGEDPTKDYSFKWFPATFAHDGNKNTPALDAKYDVFQGQVKPALANPYDVALRFSTDNGAVWYYADGKEDTAYNAADAVKLAVEEPPDGYCQVNTDCILSKYLTTCKVVPEWGKSKCVQCLQSKDCAASTWALGPTCNQERCTCAKKEDCAGNKNGGGCVQATYCGCESNDDCDWSKGEQCAQDEKTGLQICVPGS
jgi:hypothetical protein